MIYHRQHIRLKEVSLRMIEKRKARRQVKKLKRQVRKARGQARWYERPNLLPLLRHLLPLWLILSGSYCSVLHAQVSERMFNEDTRFDSIPTGSLRAEVDAVAFFHDNEYKSEIQKGYTLPGMRLIPHLAYNPHEKVNIELGVSMLFYNGANKYPCYAYHDIGTWKGNQYQRGCHALPWIRLQGSFKYVDVVVGDIYGASNHRLAFPLYNAEQNLSADPESGVQVLVHTQHFKSDTWCSWESYIFEHDSHQEAFTVGESMRILWGKTDKRWQCYTPLQLTIQHRGGEQDTTHMGVQTLINGSLGIAVEGKPTIKHVDYFTAQTNAIACYQQAGNLWPFDSGLAFHAGMGIGIYKHLHLTADYLHSPRQFISLFGNPFFGTVSLKNPGVTYHGTNVFRLGFGYQYTFSKAYTLGAQAEAFTQHASAYQSQPRLSETNFSFGVYFRVCPSFLIKRFNGS